MDRREMLRAGVGFGVMAVGGRWLLACKAADDAGTKAATTRAPVASTAAPDTTGAGSTATTVSPGPGYGALAPPDANGLRMPNGFTSRVIATSGQPVASTGYVWHPNPDGGATFPAADGGWTYVSNSETSDGQGGVSMVRFDRTGQIVEARSIATGTSRNCAGGATPWGTWLTCEEVPDGQVHECDPSGTKPAAVRPGLGRFNHEAVAVDPDGKVLYLTEDAPDGGLYRFRPAAYPDLTTGTLEVMTEEGGALGWTAVLDPSAASVRTAKQVPSTKAFNGGEGICFHAGAIFFTTKGDNRVWRYVPSKNELDVVYDAKTATVPELTGVDNITAARNGDLYVAEDGGDMQVVQLVGPDPAAVVQVVGVDGSEITGPAFSPDGTRLYFSSQRNPGTTYEVAGPWRQ